MDTENAIIESVSIRLDRGVFLCPWIHVKGPGWGCGFPNTTKDPIAPAPYLAFFITRVLDTLEIDNWEALPDTRIRVRTTGGAPILGDKIVAIGHWMEPKWFDLREIEQFHEKWGKRG